MAPSEGWVCAASRSAASARLVAQGGEGPCAQGATTSMHPRAFAKAAREGRPRGARWMRVHALLAHRAGHPGAELRPRCRGPLLQERKVTRKRPWAKHTQAQLGCGGGLVLPGPQLGRPRSRFGLWCGGGLVLPGPQPTRRSLVCGLWCGGGLVLPGPQPWYLKVDSCRGCGGGLVLPGPQLDRSCLGAIKGCGGGLVLPGPQPRDATRPVTIRCGGGLVLPGPQPLRGYVGPSSGCGGGLVLPGPQPPVLDRRRHQVRRRSRSAGSTTHQRSGRARRQVRRRSRSAGSTTASPSSRAATRVRRRSRSAGSTTDRTFRHLVEHNNLFKSFFCLLSLRIRQSRSYDRTACQWH